MPFTAQGREFCTSGKEELEIHMRRFRATFRYEPERARALQSEFLPGTPFRLPSATFVPSIPRCGDLFGSNF
jgi:hypothetical protein